MHCYFIVVFFLTEVIVWNIIFCWQFVFNKLFNIPAIQSSMKQSYCWLHFTLKGNDDYQLGRVL